MGMRKGQYEICKVCKYCRVGVVRSKRYGDREMQKCYYQSQRGNALCNLDICPKEKTLINLSLWGD